MRNKARRKRGMGWGWGARGGGGYTLLIVLFSVVSVYA
jgi:hypothetical protein